MTENLDSIQALRDFVGSNYNFRTPEGEQLMRLCAANVIKKVLAGADDVQALCTFAEGAGMLFEDHSKDTMIFPFPQWIYELVSLGRVWPETRFTVKSEVEARALLARLPTLAPIVGREISNVKK
jgi:hypothetical protein